MFLDKQSITYQFMKFRIKLLFLFGCAKYFLISRDAELIPICNRLLTDLHVIRKMKYALVVYSTQT